MGQPRRELKEASHFIQEDAGPKLARIIIVTEDRFDIDRVHWKP